jgi:hypothetical protein
MLPPDSPVCYAATHPGPAFGEHAEGVEEMQAVLGGGRQAAADRAELPGAGEGRLTESLAMRMSRSEPLSAGIRQSVVNRR